MKADAPTVHVRITKDMARALQALQEELGEQRVSSVARVALEMGLNRLAELGPAFRRAAYREGTWIAMRAVMAHLVRVVGDVANKDYEQIVAEYNLIDG